MNGKDGTRDGENDQRATGGESRIEDRGKQATDNDDNERRVDLGCPGQKD
jgi:hypothetical protein